MAMIESSFNFAQRLLTTALPRENAAFLGTDIDLIPKNSRITSAIPRNYISLILSYRPMSRENYYADVPCRANPRYCSLLNPSPLLLLVITSAIVSINLLVTLMRSVVSQCWMTSLEILFRRIEICNAGSSHY